MNLQLYKDVISRFRYLVVAGVALAIVLAFLSYVRVSFDGGLSLTYRQQESWESQSTLLLTDGGFQLGRDPRFTDPYRFSGLATIYARLAVSDEVRRMRRGEPVPGKFFALPDFSRGDILLPTITTLGQSPSPSAAKKLVARGTDAFVRYLALQQESASIPPGQRVRLQVLSAPSPAKLLVPRRKTLPIVVFLAVLTATIALAFVLENTRSRVTRVIRVPDTVPEVDVRFVDEDELVVRQPEPVARVSEGHGDASRHRPADVQPEPIRVVVKEPVDEPPTDKVEDVEGTVATRRWA